jgi:hypothetical protein
MSLPGQLPLSGGRRIPITALGNGVICRAIVSLPASLTEPDRPLQERVVFFEAPARQGAGRHLEKVLASVWGGRHDPLVRDWTHLQP